MIDSFKGKYAFLSNFYPSPVRRFEYMFPTVENAYQASKCINLGDIPRFVKMPPSGAKRLGGIIKRVDGWDAIRITVMRELLELKFEHGSAMADLLIKTGEEQLVEGNNWGDRFWGVRRGSGENHLGLLLMQIRTQLLWRY